MFSFRINANFGEVMPKIPAVRFNFATYSGSELLRLWPGGGGGLPKTKEMV